MATIKSWRLLRNLPQPEQPPRLWECRPPAFKTVAKETFVVEIIEPPQWPRRAWLSRFLRRWHHLLLA
ncbi:hypothetical protein [Streptomyces sirii]|uniref:hypothetical protein n=1 Tax=Streptomyces sirii TaxID=3127701 RepID=UPI003D36B130